MQAHRVLTAAQLDEAEEVAVLNSLRGMRPARLLAASEVGSYRQGTAVGVVIGALPPIITLILVMLPLTSRYLKWQPMMPYPQQYAPQPSYVQPPYPPPPLGNKPPLGTEQPPGYPPRQW